MRGNDGVERVINKESDEIAVYQSVSRKSKSVPRSRPLPCRRRPLLRILRFGPH